MQKISFFGRQITIVASEEYVEAIRFSLKSDEDKTNDVTTKVAA